MFLLISFLLYIFNLFSLAERFKQCGSIIKTLGNQTRSFYDFAKYVLLLLLIKLTTTFTITSFSSVRLSAIISVSATRVLSAMRLCPSWP